MGTKWEIGIGIGNERRQMFGSERPWGLGLEVGRRYVGCFNSH
jgi:hypothetical protein